jgi:hypothetical protein
MPMQETRREWYYYHVATQLLGEKGSRGVTPKTRTRNDPFSMLLRPDIGKELTRSHEEVATAEELTM